MTGKGKPLASTAQLQKTVYALAIVLALGFAYVGLGGQVPQLFASTPGEGAKVAIIQSEGAMCSAADKTPSTMKYLAQYKDLSNNVETPVNTTVEAHYGIGANVEASVLFSSTTSASGGYTSFPTVTCGSEVTSYIGDGGATYYYSTVKTDATKTTKDATLITAELKKSSAITVTFQNSSSGNWGSTIAQSGITSGQQGFNRVKMQIQAGQYYYGDGALEVCAQYDATNISKVSFGSTATELSDNDKSLSVGAGTDTNCYEVSTQLFNSNSVELPVVIDAASSVVPVNSSIRVYVNDATFRIKNGVPADRYFNKDTKADLGRAATNVAAAIVVN